MGQNAKQARKAWEAKQAELKPTPVKPTRKRTLTAEERRENALYRHAQMVYDYDRDFDVEFS
jgi:hypothetical protein